MSDIVLKYPLDFIYLFIPVCILIIMILGRKKKAGILSRLGMSDTVKNEKIRIAAMIIGLVMICLAIMGPQKLNGTMEIKKEGLDIYILLDTSKSMLVEDVVPNRLEREKQIVNRILDGLEGDRIGFIPFSSSAYIQMPLTDDYNMAKMFLEVVDTDMIGGGGSDVGAAITLAYKSFERTTQGDKVILIISDGEEHAGESEKVLNRIKGDRLKVYAIGIGTNQGGLIPIYDQSCRIESYKKDKDGNHVMSKLNDATLRRLADIGHGKYFMSTLEASEINAFLTTIAALKKDGKKSTQVNQYKHLYPYFLAIGLLLFLAAYLMPMKNRRKSI